MSGRGHHIIVFGVLHPPYPLPGKWSASDLRASGVALISIISVI